MVLDDFQDEQLAIHASSAIRVSIDVCERKYIEIFCESEKKSKINPFT